jgi:hypothetical protein
LYKVCISGVVSFVGVFTCCLTLSPDKKSSQRSGACCENGRYTSLCRTYSGVYSRAGEWDETNTNSELKIIVSLRLLFGY